VLIPTQPLKCWSYAVFFLFVCFSKSLNFYVLIFFFSHKDLAGRWWLTPVILATQEAEIRKITVQSQLWANSLQDPISKNPSHTHTKASGVAQHVGPEFKPQPPQKTKDLTAGLFWGVIIADIKEMRLNLTLQESRVQGNRVLLT
jgi:hypothetical protein